MFEDFSFCTECGYYDRDNRRCNLFNRQVKVCGCQCGEVRKPRNNFERLRSMSMEEMAAFLGTVMSGGYGKCPDGYYDCSNRESCAECWAEWLKEEIE